MTNRKVNAGIDAQTGFALQRNLALHLLLDRYDNDFKNRKYFICIEHHDDFVFCFLNENDQLQTVEAYQSKKKSSGVWKLNDELCEVVQGLLDTGKKISDDEMLKSDDYIHQLHFCSNTNIDLSVTINKQITPFIVKENLNKICFKNLDEIIKAKIKASTKITKELDQLDYLHFLWIDFNRTVKEQINQLIGQMTRTFGDKISSPKSAIETLIAKFDEKANIYNQDNQAKFLDENKHITHIQIEETISVITTKSKCYKEWRDRKDDISIALQIKPFEQDQFENTFETAFDLFKDIQNAEHRLILEFVEDNYKSCNAYTIKDVVAELFDLFRYKMQSNFKDLDLKAVLYAAYFEVINI